MPPTIRHVQVGKYALRVSPSPNVQKFPSRMFWSRSSGHHSRFPAVSLVRRRGSSVLEVSSILCAPRCLYRFHIVIVVFTSLLLFWLYNYIAGIRATITDTRASAIRNYGILIRAFCAVCNTSTHSNARVKSLLLLL